MIKNTRNSNLLLLFLIIISSSLKGQEKTLTKEEDDALIDSKERILKVYLVQYIDDRYEERSSQLWNRNYSSGYAMDRSVEPNRRMWKQILHPTILEKTGAMKKVPYEV